MKRTTWTRFLSCLVIPPVTVVMVLVLTAAPPAVPRGLVAPRWVLGRQVPVPAAAAVPVTARNSTPGLISHIRRMFPSPGTVWNRPPLPGIGVCGSFQIHILFIVCYLAILNNFIYKSSSSATFEGSWNIKGVPAIFTGIPRIDVRVLVWESFRDVAETHHNMMIYVSKTARISIRTVFLTKICILMLFF
ncbi:hypothetical protein TNIN_274821 [Trichonephila inaurata madagascariensis]|uniref:Uncharacterized protein n=1 Tax=Trichonephila inaurata madagascariensis TaxID=2747483 RepID=A0A8X6X9I0_9ARAC|nr:hypothetical protein TNIN_274821 [Trichonephila inaurata madagascariensis]